MSTDIVEEIKRLKKEKNALLLAHNYQEPLIQQLADFMGDSLELSQKANNVDSDIIIFAGAEFMAETAAILNPEKKVLIPSSGAKCPMAHMISPDTISQYKNQYPKAAVAVYVNTNAETKAMADVCITSGNAAKVISRLNSDQILVGPDRNLAWYIQQELPKKEIIPFPEIGHCYVHRKFTVEDIQTLSSTHPEAEIIVHPETDPSIQKLADKIRSTSGIIKEAHKSESKKFIIATEIGLIDRLRSELPSKSIIPARQDAICIQQKKITTYNLYLSLLNERFEIRIPPDVAKRARLTIERMLELSI
ncbi:MAG: quinolinate synthase NadA [Candidatus Hodarchaeales archaeon]